MAARRRKHARKHTGKKHTLSAARRKRAHSLAKKLVAATR